MAKTRIILDAFGGDNAPLEVLRGARQAVDELDVQIVLCGGESALQKVAAENGISLDGMEIVHAEKVMPVEEAPTEILKQYRDSTMGTGLQLLADRGGDAFVSAGSTGALTAGGTMMVGRIKGIKRPAIGTVIPMGDGAYMLVDVGANSECRPEMLRQFGIMGNAYMERLMGVERPRVGLVNIGTEETKGLELQVQAYALLQDSPLNFIGNIEARQLPLGGCDVAVCDGFTGNIVLKLTEGMGKLMSVELKRMLLASGTTKIAAVLLKKQLEAFKRKMDYTEYGGAPLLGLRQPVIKAHGSSNAKAFKNAIRQAKLVCEKNVLGTIEQALQEMKKGES